MAQGILEFPVVFGNSGAQLCLQIAEAVVRQLHAHLDHRVVEQGGILGMTGGVVTHYHHDNEAVCDRNLFQPSGQLEEVLTRWHQAEIAFVGLIHSHPEDRPALSRSDRQYAQLLLQNNPWLQQVVMGVMAGSKLLFYGFDRSEPDVLSLTNYPLSR